MKFQELKDGLFEFGKTFGFRRYDDLNVADLADLLVRLNEVGRTALHRIEVLLDERGERTTEVFVEPGITVKEVGLGVSVRPDGGVLVSEPKDYRKMLDEVGGWDNELAAVPAGGVREVVEEVESLRVRVADLIGQVDEARKILRPIRVRVGAKEGEDILQAFERKFAELEEASGGVTTTPPGATETCPLCNGSGVGPATGGRVCSTCDGTGKREREDE